MGGKFGPSNKVIDGYDSVGDAYTGDFNAPHAVHLAGILAAAYKAKLNAYRVSGCFSEGSTTDDVIISALVRAYEDGNDVITLDIASIQNAILSNDRLIPCPRVAPLPHPEQLPLYAISSDVNVLGDAYKPIPSSTPDLSDNGDHSLLAGNYSGNYTRMFISQQDGASLVQRTIFQSMILSFPNLKTKIPTSRGGLISDFSSYGPSNDMYLGTSIAARRLDSFNLPSHGKKASTALVARAIFQNTTIPVKETKSVDSLLDTAVRQDSGLI
ncbi:Minor extracellular protease vpr [Ceratobasidium theobromae]|uniref:Minor extracellular protease vpr n=1 Tax=Ceratobasidium theobromae TaxID=1582974 RepID=A0A5N5QAN8_9AGAM|nr:Minor extracellular protease vpr [Ceratobasidium theobromae]